MPETLHLACAADAAYAPHCAAMLHSALAHTGGLRAHVHFLHEPRFPAESLRRLCAMVERAGAGFDAVTVDDARLDGLRATADISRVTWFRILLPELRPQLARVLYLDCDTIVADSLRPLWETPLADHLVAAVPNVTEPRLATRHHALGLPADRAYFNGGVLLMNLELMRHNGSVERILRHAREHGERLIWMDQDSLNLELAARCHYLHPRWNCMNSLLYWRGWAEQVFGPEPVAEALHAPAVIHFEGPLWSKPWHYLCTHPQRERYWHHLRQTGFPDPPLIGRTFRNIVLRHSARARGALRRAVGKLRRGLRVIRSRLTGHADV